MRAVILLGIALVLLALALATATARTSGASSRSTFVIGLLAVLAGPWGWTLRAQTTALPCFAGALWLLIDASRNGVRRRTLLVLPLLVIWANLHGSVVLGAGLAVLLGIVELVRVRRLAWIPLALVVLSPLTVLASPYGTKLIAYYDLMLVDAPFAPILREWQWSRPDATTALFWLLAIVAVALLAMRRCRIRLTAYELAVLAVTFVGAVQAVRGVIWFALAAAAILPVALDGLLTKADVSAPRLNRIISLAALAGLAVAAVAFLARPASWYVSEWPERQVEAVRAATRDPNVRVWATDGTADWLLWRIPDLRGRLAYDVRFELYDERGARSDRRLRAPRAWLARSRPRVRRRGRRRSGAPPRAPPRAWNEGRLPRQDDLRALAPRTERPRLGLCRRQGAASDSRSGPPTRTSSRAACGARATTSPRIGVRQVTSAYSARTGRPSRAATVRAGPSRAGTVGRRSSYERSQPSR